MKRFIAALVVACALATALAASPALAGIPLGGGGSQDQTVTNSTSQENQAGALNVPVLSGNNVSVLGGGSQSSSTGISQSQENENTTDQQASQSQASDPSQDQSVSNTTSQENEAGAVNVPIASGNNISVLSGGSQTSSTGISQSQEDENTTKQWVSQSGSGCGCSGDQDQSVSNRTKQENEAFALNAPILSGNNVSILSKGSQSSSTGISQSQENENTTKQWVSQGGSTGSCCERKSKCPPKPCDGQKQTVSNRTKQENEAYALNAPIASGNNVAVLSKVCQTSSTGVSQTQENENVTWQQARQAA